MNFIDHNIYFLIVTVSRWSNAQHSSWHETHNSHSFFNVSNFMMLSGNILAMNRSTVLLSTPFWGTLTYKATTLKSFFAWIELFVV